MKELQARVWGPDDCGTTIPTLSWLSLVFMTIASVMLASHLILWCLLLLLPSVFISIRDFPHESAVHIRWPKYWSFSFSISPSNSGLISLKIHWFDPLAVQGTFRSFLQHHSLKASILWCSTFFTVQFSELDMTTGKTRSLTTWTFVGRVMSPFQTYCLGLSQLSCQVANIYWFHGCSHCPQWFWSPRRGTCHYFHLFPSMCHEGMGLDAMILAFLIFSCKPALSLPSFALIKRLFSSSLLSAIRVVSPAYLRLLMLLLPILILACNSFSLVFLMMCSAYS